MISKKALLILVSIVLCQTLPAEKPLSYLNLILSSTEKNLDKNYKRISAGNNLLPDDPTKYTIYEKLKAHIRELEATISNHSDMISYYRVAEHYLKQIIDLLQKIRELLVKRSNFIYVGEAQEYIDLEINQYYQQILFTLKNAEFNTIRIFEDLLADDILQARFKGEEYFQLSNVDRLLSFFIRQRTLFGTLIKTLYSRNRGLALEAENLKGFQSSLWHIDISEEISRFKKHHLLFIINLLLI